MTEGEYNRVGNLARVRSAYEILQHLHIDYGVTEEEKKLLLNILDRIQERISKTMEVKKDDR